MSSEENKHKFGLIPFNFWTLTAKKLPESSLNLYNTVLGCYYGDENLLREPLQRRTIPFSESDLLKLTQDHKAQSNFIRQLPSFDLDVNDLIIDIRSGAKHGISSDKLSKIILRVIANFLSPRCEKARVFLLKSTEYNIIDPNWIDMENIISTGQLICIFDNGQMHSKNGITDLLEYKKEIEKSSISLIHKNEIELCKEIRKKLIRRVGVFVKNMTDIENVTLLSDDVYFYFYDCEYCIPEIKELIQREIKNKNFRFDAILYDDEMSPWMEGVARDLSKNTNAIQFSTNEINALIKHSPSNVLHITPMIDSGTTVVSTIKQLNTINGLREVFTISILSTSKEEDQELDCVEWNHIPNQEINYLYLLKVNRPSKGELSYLDQKVKQWITPRLMKDELFSIGSHAILLMFKEAGFAPEEPVPENRNSMGFIPRLKALSELNGPWLAKKVDQQLKKIPGDKGSIPLFVCPTEPAALAFTESIINILKHDVVSIPRDVLNEVKNVTEEYELEKQKDKIKQNHQDEEWLIQLSTNRLQKHHRIIVIDEFNMSGGTHKSINRLLKMFELRVHAHVSIIDFNPNNESNRHVHSLYQIDLLGWREAVGV